MAPVQWQDVAILDLEMTLEEVTQRVGDVLCVALGLAERRLAIDELTGRHGPAFEQDIHGAVISVELIEDRCRRRNTPAHVREEVGVLDEVMFFEFVGESFRPTGERDEASSAVGLDGGLDGTRVAPHVDPHLAVDGEEVGDVRCWFHGVDDAPADLQSVWKRVEAQLYSCASKPRIPSSSAICR